MGDRPLQERGDQRAEGRQQLELGLVQREAAAPFVAGQEAEAARVADQRDDHEGADPEPADDLLRYGLLVGGILHEDRATGHECRLERAESPDRERRRE